MLVGFQAVLSLRTISLSRFLTVKASDLNYMCACVCERVHMLVCECVCVRVCARTCTLGPGGLSVNSERAAGQFHQ